MPVINIDRLAYGGSGFGKIDGKACFVPFTAPGDTADISIASDKSSYSEGVVNEVLSSAACRVKPVCPVFGDCGGCNWQHVSYEEQCRQKEQIFVDTLWRSARLDATKILPIIVAQSPLAYRQRIQLKINCAAGRLSIGFHRAGSHFVVDINDNCPIAVKAINKAILAVRVLLQDCGEADKVPQVDLAASADGQVAAVVHYIGNNQESFAQQLLTGLEKVDSILGLSLQTGRKSTVRHLTGPVLLNYLLPDADGGEQQVNFSPHGFSQVNFHLNRALVSAVIAFYKKIPPGTILDLFSGNGNFSLPLACIAQSIIGLESYDDSVIIANNNAVANNITNASFICQDAASGLEQLVKTGSFFDLVIIDPPRSGAVDVVRNIYRTKATHVIYISCDPTTLARDVNILQKSGYQVIDVQPVDMFPQTYHLESITFLRAAL